MLYVYFGEDTEAARGKVQATISSMLAKSPEALYFRITSDDIATHSITELTQSQGLFKSEYVVLLDTLLATKEGEAYVLDALADIAESPHPFFVLEGKLLAPVRKKFEKQAAKMQEFTLTKGKTSEESFNMFALTDALGARDTKQLWMLFREAKSRGVSDEEIHGLLFWMLKSLVLAANSRSAQEAGMKPYPFDKAKRYVRNFSSPDEIVEHMKTMALLPHRAHSRSTPIEIELERFILSL